MQLHANITGNGQPLIILHGFLGMGDNWKTLGTKFSKEDYEVHLVDQRNHGRSFHSPAFNYELLAEDLKYYIDQHQLIDIALLGHSMGGKTAMFFAAKYPYIVSKLILADIAPRFYPRHHDHILKGLQALDFNTITSRTDADAILNTYVLDFGTRQFLLKNLYRKSKTRFDLRINLEALVANIDEVGKALPAHCIYTGKSLFLKGGNSDYITTNDYKQIKVQFPKAKIVTIPNAAHWLHAENPIDFLKNSLAFLKS